MAPEWVPYRERIQPGDLSPGDLLPVDDDDPRLVPTYSFGDDPLDADDKAQVRSVASDLGLGRVRTLSLEGRDLAAQRWYDGDGGPESPIAQAAPDSCRTCGFLVRIAGSLAETFGVCANGDANDDGRVVTLRPRLRRPLRGTSGAQARAPALSRAPCTTPSPTTSSSASEPGLVRLFCNAVEALQRQATAESRISGATGPTLTPVRAALGAGGLAAAAVLEAEEAEAGAGEAGPQPPGAVRVGEAPQKGSRARKVTNQMPRPTWTVRTPSTSRARRRPRCRSGCRSRAWSARVAAPRGHPSPRAPQPACTPTGIVAQVMSYAHDMPTVQNVARTDAGLASELRVSVMRLRRRLIVEGLPDEALSLTQMRCSPACSATAT